MRIMYGEAALSIRRFFFGIRWRKMACIGASIAANVLYASFAVAQPTLQRLDPLIFAALQMSLLLPAAVLFWYRASGNVSSHMIRQGIIGGLLLGLGFLGVALSLHTIGIVRAAALTGCDGIAASLIARGLFRQRQSGRTGLACVLAGGGVLLVWGSAPGAWQADLLALMVGILFCGYALFLEQTGLLLERNGQEWAFLSVVCVTMAALSLLIALCFGSWASLRTFSWADLCVLGYASWATLLIPMLLTTFLLRNVSAVSLSFLALLEPLASLGFAWWGGAIQMPLPGWLGVGLLLVSLLVQAAAASLQPQKPSSREKEFPLLCILSGKPSLRPEESRWKYAPDVFKEHQTLVLSLTTRHLFLVEWRDEMISLPMEMALTGNETNLLHALWTAYPDACDLFEAMTFMERERQLLWRTVTSVRKKLRHFGIDLVACDQGYLLVAYGGEREG